MPRGEFKHRIGSLPTLQISLGIVALFEKNYDGEPILTVVSNIGEDVLYLFSFWNTSLQIFKGFKINIKSFILFCQAKFCN
jgi:hypothetical protein